MKAMCIKMMIVVVMTVTCVAQTNGLVFDDSFDTGLTNTDESPAIRIENGQYIVLLNIRYGDFENWGIVKPIQINFSTNLVQ